MNKDKIIRNALRIYTELAKPRMVRFRLPGETSGYRYGPVLPSDTREDVQARLNRAFKTYVTILEITEKPEHERRNESEHSSDS